MTHPSKRKFTESQVLEIRNRVASGEPVESLASSFGIPRTHALRIVTGVYYPGVGGPVRPSMKGDPTPEEIRQMTEQMLKERPRLRVGETLNPPNPIPCIPGF